MPTPARPGLSYSGVDDMVADVDLLCASPCEHTGQWSLAMILDHLAKGMTADGMKPVPWPFSAVARLFIRRMIRRNQYPSFKIPAAKPMRPTPTIDVAAAAAEFRSAAEKLKELSGPTVETPFGELSADELKRMMLLHAAHHLSYVKSATP